MTLTPELLVEIRQIEELKYRYLRCLDLKCWDDLAELLLPDATASYGGGAYEFSGRDDIMVFLRKTMGSESILSSHKCHHPEISFEANGTVANGVWALDDVVVRQDYGLTLRGAAYYYDTYHKVDGHWLIASTGYKRVYEEFYPRASVEGLRVTADYWATGGRSKLPAE